MKYEWPGSGFTAHGKKGDPRRAALSRPKATAPKKRSLSEQREGHLVRSVAKARREADKLQQENAALRQEVQALRASAANVDLANLAGRFTLTYAKLAQKYNALLEQRQPTSSINPYGSNINKNIRVLDAELEADFSVAASSALAHKMGVPSLPAVSPFE